jgi:hypothetical protein
MRRTDEDPFQGRSPEEVRDLLVAAYLAGQVDLSCHPARSGVHVPLGNGWVAFLGSTLFSDFKARVSVGRLVEGPDGLVYCPYLRLHIKTDWNGGVLLDALKRMREQVMAGERDPLPLPLAIRGPS